MNTKKLLQEVIKDPKALEVASMLYLSPLPRNEKRIWLWLLPTLSEEEKDLLLDNLRAEVSDFIRLTDKTLKKFVTEMA